jgi:hypothetical protein
VTSEINCRKVRFAGRTIVTSIHRWAILIEHYEGTQKALYRNEYHSHIHHLYIHGRATSFPLLILLFTFSYFHLDCLDKLDEITLHRAATSCHRMWSWHNILVGFQLVMKYYESDNNTRLISINFCIAQRKTKPVIFTHTYCPSRWNIRSYSAETIILRSSWWLPLYWVNCVEHLLL